MEILLEKISKRYRRDWIFKSVDYHFKSGESYAILGPNGSGKSTFLRVLSSHLTPTKGKISFSKNNQKVEKDSVYESLSIAAPYIELLEEFSVLEMVNFHRKFKNFYDDISTKEILETAYLTDNADKEIRFFSSGMKQRLKLALAILSESDFLILDEPTTNLDRKGMDWYKSMITKHHHNRTLIIASNVEEDFDFCTQQLNILDYKKR